MPNNSLVPAGEKDAALLLKIKQGEVVKLELKRMRNYLFHKKFFSLLNFAYDYWSPKGSFNKWGVVPERNFDTFRKNIIILAGFYTAHYQVDGEVRLEAKSISFGSMSEDEFEKLYSACVDVILNRICTEYTGEMLDEVVDMAMAYA